MIPRVVLWLEQQSRLPVTEGNDQLANHNAAPRYAGTVGMEFGSSTKNGTTPRRRIGYFLLSQWE